MKIGEMTIIACTCKSSFQDERHGKGRRAANMRQGKHYDAKSPKFRCTVCSREV